MSDELLAQARRLADDVLFPAALEADREGTVPLDSLDALAAAGLYGVAEGGPGVAAVAEELATGCLSTTLIWIQHHTPVRAVAASATPGLRDAWLQRLLSGQTRAGVAFAYLRRPGPASMRAEPEGDGWRLSGEAPWVTGWGRIDVVLVAARTEGGEGEIVWSLVDARAGDGLAVKPLSLAAVGAAGTVRMELANLRVDAGRVVAREPFEAWRDRDGSRLGSNGFLAIGVARRAAALLETSRFDEPVAATRAALVAADARGMPAARAAASALAMRATTALVVRGGGRSLLLDQHPQRLAREALFLQVFGQTGTMREAQLAALLEPDVR